MKQRVFFLTTAIVAAAICGTSVLAQGQSPSLAVALSRIRSGMASAGIRRVENTPSGQQISTNVIEPVSFDSCTIQIRAINDSTMSAGGHGAVFTAIFTIPLGKLDVTKIRVGYSRDYSREGNSTFITSLTSSRDGEKGYAQLTLSSIGQEKAISSVAIYTLNHDRRPSAKNSGRFEANLNSLEIAFKYKKDAENVAAAFAEASRLCSTSERKER